MDSQVDRDPKTGRLLPGHKPTFKAFKPGQNVGGAPHSLTTQVKDALQLAKDAMPQLILDMIRDAQDETASIRDRQACREYLCDRIYGKANQPLSGKFETVIKEVEVRLNRKE